MEEYIWKPVSISRSGPLITHSCSADDLFTFVEASIEQVEVIKHCLDVFENSYG